MKCWWVHLGKYSIWVLPCLLTTTSSILLLAQHQIIAVGANQHLLFQKWCKKPWKTKHTTCLNHTTHNSILCNRKKNDGLVIFTHTTYSNSMTMLFLTFGLLLLITIVYWCFEPKSFPSQAPTPKQHTI